MLDDSVFRPLGLLGVGFIVALVLCGIFGAEEYGLSVAAAYFAVGLFAGTFANRRIVLRHLKDGWVFSEPETPATLRAIKVWRLKAAGGEKVD